jgi:hypothetical protein
MTALNDLLKLYTKVPFIVFAAVTGLALLTLFMISRLLVLVNKIDLYVDAPPSTFGPESEPVVVSSMEDDDSARVAASIAPLVSASPAPARHGPAPPTPAPARYSSGPVFSGTPLVERIFEYVQTIPLASRLWFLAVSYSTIGGALSSCNLLMTKSMCVRYPMHTRRERCDGDAYCQLCAGVCGV